MREKILELLDKTVDLPPFPTVLDKLLEILKDPKAGIGDIADLVKMDAALAGKIIFLANSAYYNSGVQEVKSLGIAISKLGLSKIKHIVYSIELTKLFIYSKVLDCYKFWRHNLAVAIVTQQLSNYTKTTEEVQDIAYLAGLMHDVGIMVFSYLIPGQYAEFTEKLHEKEKPIEKQEESRFGIDHQELGALFLGRLWHADEEIVNAVRNHHRPFHGLKQIQQCQQLLNVANGICNCQGFSNGIICYHEIFNEGAWEKLELSLSDVENILRDVNNSVDQATKLLGYSKK
jgi:HD-like signal output (HDOD) protein